MQRTLLTLIVSVVLLVAGCGSDSSLPEATGKGTIRAINAIPTSPQISFLIEERAIGSVDYQGATAPDDYDDLSYTFNFEVFYAGETTPRRFASQSLDIVADRDYVLLLSGSLASPTITVWESDERTFVEADTVFAARFAHASATLGNLDYYFADEAVTPALGNQAATLSFGEVADAADFDGGDYVLTITTAGDPTDVLYTSATRTFVAADSYLLTAFDGDASDAAPVVVSAFGTLFGTSQLPDINSPPTAQFINGSMGLGTVDIYNDEMLTSRVVADHAFQGVSGQIDLVLGENTFYYTPAGDTSTVLIETPLSAFGGLLFRFVAVGEAGEVSSIPFAPDLRSVETGAKISLYNSSINFSSVDVYAVEPGTDIDATLPIFNGLTAGFAVPPGTLPAGSFELFVTENGETTVLAGPYTIDGTAGDVIDLIVLDTVDPAVLDVLFLSGGPGT
ncbi:MAG: DUF4397 domain-containing protein [Woeseiaceae bacterium]